MARCLAWILLCSLLAVLYAQNTDTPSSIATNHQLPQQRVENLIVQNLDELVKLYEHFHANPELSMREVQTAARMAQEFRAAGYDVTERVGGTGVVAVLHNGPGKTVLLRADMDALPIQEQTGLPYASKVITKDRFGQECPAMHACGHDLHMTILVAAARILAACKDAWNGTLVLIAQPAEEIGLGAKAMLEDGLLTRFPKPDYALALHADARTKVGTVSYTEGLAMANVDSVDILVKGIGGHGSAPHTTVDPIVLAARMILDLQTIASREVDPTEPVVITVGSIHGGTKHNIIPSEVKLQVTVRTFNDQVRDQVLKSIDRHCKACALGAGAPEPTVTVHLDEYTPALRNDAELTRTTMALFRQILGKEQVTSRPPMMGGEDFGQFGHQGIPICMYWLGTVSEDRMHEARKNPQRPLPSTHSDLYAPDVKPSISTGALTLSLAALNLLSNDKQ